MIGEKGKAFLAFLAGNFVFGLFFFSFFAMTFLLFQNNCFFCSFEEKGFHSPTLTLMASLGITIAASTLFLIVLEKILVYVERLGLLYFIRFLRDVYLKHLSYQSAREKLS